MKCANILVFFLRWRWLWGSLSHEFCALRFFWWSCSFLCTYLSPVFKVVVCLHFPEKWIKQRVLFFADFKNKHTHKKVVAGILNSFLCFFCVVIDRIILYCATVWRKFHSKKIIFFLFEETVLIASFTVPFVNSILITYFGSS